MHLGMGHIRGPSGKKKAKLGLIFVLCKFCQEKPSSILCNEPRVVIKLVSFNKYILASFHGSSGLYRNKANFYWFYNM